VAVPSFQTNQVLVLFGNGDGTFRSPVFYGTGPNPQFALAVDLNPDGNLDLVVTSQGDPPLEAAGINVFLGNPDGSFQSPSFIAQPDWTIEVPYMPDFIAASDFDGDGNMDLLVQAIGDPLTVVMYGSGTGTFQVTTVPTVALGNTCVVADFNGDGKPDIVCAGYGFTIVTNTGNRTFSANTYFPGAFGSVAAGDFNNDGKQDLVLTGGPLGDSAGAYIYLNSRATTMALVGVYPLGPQYGQPSQLSATINTDVNGYNTGCFSTCPVGTITWFDGNVALGTAPVAPGSNHSGTATFGTYFSGGLHSVSASYAGAELPSTSATITFEVVQAPSMLTVAASPSSPVYGTSVTITVGATAASTSMALPTGTVSIQDNGAALATLSLNASGQASIASLVSGGAHTVQAKYGGDANYLSAVATTSFVVQPAPVQLNLACAPNPAASEEAVSCISQVSDKTATGSVTFDDGAKALGSATLAAGQAVLHIGTLAAGTHTLQASYSGDSNFMTAQAPSFIQTVTPATQVTVIAAADGAAVLAPQAIGSAYGSGFASGVAIPNPGPLPTTLAGVRMTITDASGTQQAAPLFFVSPTQINFLTPTLVPGAARVQISNAAGELFTGPLSLELVSPALFSANADGKGVAAAYVLQVSADGVQSTQPVYTCGNTPGSCTAVPVDLGAPGDQNFLVLYGSGIRYASKVSVLLGGNTSDVVFFGPQGQFVGLDQVNVQIPADLAGQGDVHIALTADGQDANELLMQIK
jgi:uncharacterized protein (TIGR03437 family)